MIYTAKEMKVIKLWNLGYNVPKIKMRTCFGTHVIKQTLRKKGISKEAIEARG